MTQFEIEAKIESLNEWEALMEEAKAEVEAIKDELKAELIDRDTEELKVNDRYILRWTSVLSSRFDTKRFKEQFSDLYKNFTKEVSSKRFSISA